MILPGRAWGGGTPEDGNDTTDEDGDGSLLTRRIYVSSMGGPVISDFTLGTGAVQSSTWNEDIVTFTTGPSAGAAKMSLNSDLPFTTGELTVVLRIKSQTGFPMCYLTVGWEHPADSTSGTAATDLVTSGTLVKAFSSVPEESTITDLVVECRSKTPGDTMVLDWLAVQNGRYKWAPINDVSANPSTTGLPGMGRKGFVRAAWTEDGLPGGRLFAGGDVGGFAWSDDGLAWNMANGEFDEWIYDGQPGVWDAFAIETADAGDQSVWVLGGHKDLDSQGGLYYTAALDDFNQSWARLDGPSGERLGTSKHDDICYDLGSGRGKGVSSGTLMVPEPDLGSGFGNTVLIGSSAEDGTDLYVLDTATNAVTLAPYTGLPHQTDTSEPAVAPNVMISALAVDADANWLLVGYRLIGYGDEENALYLCPADWSVGGACAEVVDNTGAFSFDVRDIVSHPTVGGQFYVADSGRLFLSGACGTEVESTVFSIEVDATGIVTVTDTDDAATVPTWTGGVAYYGADCPGSSGGTVGSLVPPKGPDVSAGEISSLGIDPAGTYLIATYPRDNGDRDYGCVNTFRAAVDEIHSGVLDWEPLQEWHTGLMHYYSAAATDDNVQRRSAVQGDMASSFLGSEPLPEMWAGSYTHDVCFADFGAGDYELVTAGDNVWLYPPDDGGTTVGWNSTAGDLDTIPIMLGFDDAGSTFQDPIVNGIGTCRLCSTTPAGGAVDAVLVAGLEDYKMATVYAMPSSGVREPADRPCEVHKVKSSGQAVSVWQPAGSTPQAWMSFAPQGDTQTETDSALARGLIFAADATQANANLGWCWDAVSLTGFSPSNFEGDRCNPANPNECSYGSTAADGITDLVCQDGGEHSDVWWNVCHESGVGAPLNLDEATVGTIKDLAAYDTSKAVLLAASATISGVADGEGLFLAAYGGTATGITYTAVGGGGPPIGFYNFKDQPALAVDLRHYSAGVSLPVYVTSKDSTEGGLWRVDINLATPASSTWTELDVATNCPSMTASRIYGAALNVDGTQLLVYGGQDSGRCAVDVSAWPTYTVTEAIPAAYFDIRVRDGMAHPHVDDTWFMTGYAVSDADQWSGVYIVQRRYRPDTGTWAWSSRRLSPNTQEHRMGMSLDWGPGYGTSAAGHLDRLYAGTSGGGVWELKMLWE